MSNAVSNPRVTLNLVTRDQLLGLEDQRVLIVGQMLTGTATAGELVRDLPRTNAEINALFGAGSHVAMMARTFRRRNKVTNVDVLPLADAGAAAKGTATLTLAGTATGEGTLYVSVVSRKRHRYQIDAVTDDTTDELLVKLEAKVAADTEKPYTYTDTATVATFTAGNGGNLSDDWLIMVEGSIPGITATITGWTGGATDPDLTDVFDPIGDTRYQGIVYPSCYSTAPLKTLLNSRVNVENNVLNGVGIIGYSKALATIKAEAIALNSAPIVLQGNEPVDLSTWKGCSVPEAPDNIAADFAAKRALRFEDGVSISDIVVTNEPNDQFGGQHTVTLPYFNTPIDADVPLRGTGFSFDEQRELELEGGVSVVGANIAYNGVVTGPVVTTWRTDAAGNEDDTWRYLNWFDSHAAIREYFFRNLKKEFAQARLTTGTRVPGYSMADKEAVEAYSDQLYLELAEAAITVKGLSALEYFKANRAITLVPDQRRVTFTADVPMVSQLGEILGTIKFSFNTN